jgi:protein-L-isoaspartate(D-aspartate) O-methyltransferase
LLNAAGYGDRVRVVLADAEHGVPGEGTFDRILVTAGAWDVPRSWIDHLASDGVMVVPLRLNGTTRVIAFRRDGDHLVSVSDELCGFVAIQGSGEHHDRAFFLPDGAGHQWRIRFDADPLEDPDQLDGVLAVDSGVIWSDVTIAHRTSFADLHLWCAGYLRGFCRVSAEPGTEFGAQCGKTWFPFGVVHDAGLAYLQVRSAMDGGGIEFGAHGFGTNGTAAATAYVKQIQAWDQTARQLTPTFAFWPNGADLTQLPPGAALLAKNHGLVTISWPTS